jgi:Mg-chelatase subunit ChlD
MDPAVIRESLTCPITGDIMTDPVQGNDGQTYERSAITQALGLKEESPITRQPMSVADLKVNVAIRYLLDKYNETKGTEVTVETEPEIDLSKVHYSRPVITSHGDYVMRNERNETLLTFNATSKNKTVSNKLEVGTDLVLAIDRSGSMGLTVEAKGELGSIENGFSQQDIVNHAAKTVAKSLSPDDRLAIVIFDNLVETILPLIAMSELNCVRALSQISEIKPRGQTNIWAAIETAYNILYKRSDTTRNPAILLLTDGTPNISPSRGEAHALKNLRNKKEFYPPLYTFGFGYNLKVGLLYELAQEGDGVMGHIPDGGMVATVFSNLLANILCTAAYNVQVQINYDPATKMVPSVAGDYKWASHPSKPNCIIIHIGTIQIGQSRDIIINNHENSDLGYQYIYTIGNVSYSQGAAIDHHVEFDKPWIKSSFDLNRLRYHLVEQLRKACIIKGRGMSAKEIYNELVTYVEEYLKIYDTDDSNRTIIYKMHCTLVDQIREALSDISEYTTSYNGKQVSYFDKWGRWYLDQMAMALNKQMKPNFKDAACDFGGELFNSIVDHISNQFDVLPAPTPSNLRSNMGGSGGGYRSLGGGGGGHVPISMGDYNRQSNPCFVGTSTIALADGTLKQVRDLNKGDKVVTLTDPYDMMSTQTEASVVCVLKTLTTGMVPLVTLGSGLKITQWHPVLCGTEWKFPNEIGCITHESCETVYSILFDNGHTCLINDIWCVGLGHSYDKGILNHDYFGSPAIVENLERLPGWNKGLVVINARYSIIRDPVTKCIVSIMGKGKKNISDTGQYNIPDYQNFLLQT